MVRASALGAGGRGFDPWPGHTDRQTDRQNFILFVELTTYKVFHIIQIIVSEGGITTTCFDTGPC